MSKSLGVRGLPSRITLSGPPEKITAFGASPNASVTF